MNHVKIYDTDTISEIAKKIYKHFEVMASCTIYGFVNNDGKIKPKGEMVVDYLETLDEMENIKYKGSVRMRDYKYRKDSVGGPIAHKIFTWEKRIVDNEVRYTIWRYQ